jgi:hypothetical protein
MDNIGEIKTLESLCGLRTLKILNLNETVIGSLPERFNVPLTHLAMAGIPLVKARSSTAKTTTGTLIKSYEHVIAVRQLTSEASCHFFFF